MWDKVKAVAKWIWNWVTVVVAIVMGVFSVAVDYLDQLMGVDLTQIMTQRHAAQITFGVAVTKAAVTAYNARKS